MVNKFKKIELRELNEGYNKVLNLFFSFPRDKFGINELSEELKLSKTTTKRVVLELEKEGFLKIDILGKLWRISCDKTHIYNQSRKISNNLTMIYESGILEEIHKRIPNSKAIVLFGSYRKGDDNEKSDIDIAVEVLGNNEVELLELGVLPQFGHRKNISVNLYIFSRNKVDLNLFSNIVNGIVIEGFLEVEI